MSKTVFITGVSRGIGLGLAQHYLGKGAHVFAAARNPEASRDLWELERDYGARVKILKLDVTKDADVQAAAKLVGDRPVDLLINNAGTMPKDASFDAVDLDEMRLGFDVNVLGVQRVTRALLDNLKNAAEPVVASITSKMGSIEDNTSGRYYGYRVSKTALNMLMKSFAVDHPTIATVLLHPGWVQTDMGGAGAPITVAQSVQGLTKVIDNARELGSGRFFDYRGAEIPW